MPTTTSSPGAPLRLQLLSSDVAASAAFYAGLLGWEVVADGEHDPDRVGFALGGVPVASAVLSVASMGLPDAWVTSLGATDVDATAEAVVANGGRILVAPADPDGRGRSCIAIDPTGAVVGVQRLGADVGRGTTSGHGAPVRYELHTTDPDRAVAFYEAAFGWRTRVMSDTPEFRCTLVLPEDAPLAGVIDASGTLPASVAHWIPSFGIDDLGAGLERAAELGGTVIGAVADSPFGRCATLVDPTGALLTITAVTD